MAELEMVKLEVHVITESSWLALSNVMMLLDVDVVRDTYALPLDILLY